MADKSNIIEKAKEGEDVDDEVANIDTEEDSSEISMMKKMLELEIDAKFFRRKLNDLDTKVEFLKVENFYLKGHSHVKVPFS